MKPSALVRNGLVFVFSCHLMACAQADSFTVSTDSEDEVIKSVPSGQTGTALTNPTNDTSFTILPDGKDMKKILVSGSALTLAKGAGNTFTAALKTSYANLKAATKSDPNHKLQWVMMDLDEHRVI
ncbi:MAG: hypothetical protein V4736_13340, partial [Bdellovibrionota bacterium]